MHIWRVIAGTLVTVSVIILVAIGQDKQQNTETKVRDCQAAMPAIMRQYNNARYAVQAARNSGDMGHTLTAVIQAQAALDLMEEPLKVCNDAMQSISTGQPSSKD